MFHHSWKENLIYKMKERETMIKLDTNRSLKSCCNFINLNNRWIRYTLGKKKTQLFFVKDLHSSIEWIPVFGIVNIIQGTKVIYDFLCFMEKRAKWLLCSLISHTHTSTLCCWMDSIVFPQVPCPSYCLHCLKETMHKLAVQWEGNAFYHYSCPLTWCSVWAV